MLSLLLITVVLLTDLTNVIHPLLSESSQQEYCRIPCFDFDVKLWKIIFSTHIVNFSCLLGELRRLPVNTMCVLERSDLGILTH